MGTTEGGGRAWGVGFTRAGGDDEAPGRGVAVGAGAVDADSGANGMAKAIIPDAWPKTQTAVATTATIAVNRAFSVRVPV
jgi:hypothetical protein